MLIDFYHARTQMKNIYHLSDMMVKTTVATMFFYDGGSSDRVYSLVF